MPCFERAGRTDQPESLQPTESPHFERREETWAAAERRLIMEALIKAGGRKAHAAELLGWGRSTLWRKIRKYKIDDDERAES